ncbi:MAG: sensor histidine kinase [Gammaproteobacteria bacterium]
MSNSQGNALEEAEKLQFAANLTHDLYNPIAGIKTAAQAIMLTRPHDADEERLLQHIVKTSNKLYDIIAHVLKMSKAVNEEEVICTFSLRQLIDEVVDTVLLSAEAKNLMLKVDLPSDISITTDNSRCYLILLNLVQNAIKYTRKGHVLIRGIKKENSIHIEVEDTGIGISKKNQKEIFKCYKQVKSGSLEMSGIGLGLHLSLQFAEQMSGEITIKSKKNKGSSFIFSFPLLSKDNNQEV